MSDIPRGYRNNNPLNIRINAANNWKGKVPLSQNTDGAFEQFVSMPYGFRAAFVLLRNYINGNYSGGGQPKLNTIRKLIGRWAPINENNTDNYITHVVSWSGIPADRVISASDANALIPIVYAMARQENGYYPEMSDVKEGWNIIGSSAMSSAAATGAAKTIAVLILAVTAAWFLS